MKNPKVEKSKIFTILGMGEYTPNEVVSNTILEKDTGNINAVLMAKGTQLTENLSRFEHLIQIIEGSAEILIDDNPFILNPGQLIIIPANSRNTIKANESFKMISTIIKSGYE